MAAEEGKQKNKRTKGSDVNPIKRYYYYRVKEGRKQERHTINMLKKRGWQIIIGRNPDILAIKAKPG